ncbi:flagellar assembly protein FliH [Bacillus sp. H-16]|uniref:flagellar assembly protein FliH n=1 Tax=Alteribacter salitolerans TaxID=2912333 RepID=UPI00196662E5|nr:flagellar assembly protein FliH [Alteribacter salitolerans]MBM7094172.1 flagellar assembly protein FliH [Alteribacter salitolerans]
MSKFIKSSMAKKTNVTSIIQIKSLNSEPEPKMSDDLLFEQEEAEDVTVQLERAKEEAFRLIEEANAYKEQVKSELASQRERAKEEAVSLYEMRKKEGWEKGYSDGHEAGLKACEEELAGARETVKRSRQDYLDTLEKASPDILSIALAAAEKILGTTLTEEAMWAEFVSRAVEEVKDQQEIAVYIHPDRYEETLRHKPELEQIVLSAKHIYIYPDRNLPLSGCTIETPFGKMEAGLGSQLHELKHQLKEIQRQDETDEGKSNH